MQIRGFLYRCFHSPEKLVFSIKSQKSFFTLYYMKIQGLRGGYKGIQGKLQGVTGGYKGLQGVTKDYRGVTGGSQGVTMGYRGYRGLQGVTRGYGGLQQKYLEFIFSIKTFPFNSKASIRAHKHIF